MTKVTRNPWFRAGDANAFFALMFDNVANLVILVAILVGAFGFPRDLVLHRIVPGTAVGVLVVIGVEHVDDDQGGLGHACFLPELGHPRSRGEAV